MRVLFSTVPSSLLRCESVIVKNNREGCGGGTHNAFLGEVEIVDALPRFVRVAVPGEARPPFVKEASVVRRHAPGAVTEIL
jgi:hypothetical protein